MPTPSVPPDIYQTPIDDSTVSDVNPEPSHTTFDIKDEDIVDTHQIAELLSDPDIDIRPRFFDKSLQEWVLLDTGSQVSCTKPGPQDKIDPSIRLEAVNGSIMPCYGKKQVSFKIGRKTYHQTPYITDSQETILGMDFIKPNRLEFRWGEFGDY